MNISQQTIARNTFAAGLGFVVTATLFLFLPVSYHLFQKKLQDVLGLKSQQRVAVDTVHVKQQERKEKKMTQQKNREMQQHNFSFSSRFSLDLSVLADGEGAGGIAMGGDRVLEEYEADTPPVKRVTVPPSYPARAREDGIEGVVVARILINENGKVERVVIVESPCGYGFDRCVMNALMRWKFEPARLENMPVRVWAKQEIRFTL